MKDKNRLLGMSSGEDLKSQKRGRRAYRFARLLRFYLSSFLLTGFKQVSLSPLVTLSYVIVSKDLREAKVYIRLPEESFSSGNRLEPTHLNKLKGKEESKKNLSLEETVETLNEYAFVFQAHLSHQLKSKFCPKVRFYKDEKTESILRIDSILYGSPERKT